jgi:hypothetical protein
MVSHRGHDGNLTQEPGRLESGGPRQPDCLVVLDPVP